MNLANHIRSQRLDLSGERLGVRNGATADSRELAINEIGADFPGQIGEAPIAKVFEHHHPQNDFGGKPWSAAIAASLPAPGEGFPHQADQLLVVEQCLQLDQPGRAETGERLMEEIGGSQGRGDVARFDHSLVRRDAEEASLARSSVRLSSQMDSRSFLRRRKFFSRRRTKGS